MHTDPAKLTDSLERELGEREIHALQGVALSGLAVRSLDRFLRLAGRLGALIRLLRGEARRARVDYVAG